MEKAFEEFLARFGKSTLLSTADRQMLRLAFEAGYAHGDEDGFARAQEGPAFA